MPPANSSIIIMASDQRISPPFHFLTSRGSASSSANVVVCSNKNSSGNKLPYLSPLTLPSPPLFPLRGAVEREREPVTYFRTSPSFSITTTQ